MLDCDIFVDYSGTDKSDFEEAIRTHLHAANAVLLIVTNETFDPQRIQSNQDWLRVEIREALQHSKPISMAFYDGNPPPPADSLPEDIREITKKQGVPFYSHYFKAGALELANFIAKSTPIPLKHDLPAAPQTPSSSDSTPKTTSNAARYGEAIAFFESGQYNEALDILADLKQSGYSVIGVNLDTVIAEVHKQQADEKRRWEAGEAYDQIAVTVRLNKNLARTMWQAFQKEYGTIHTVDPANIGPVFAKMDRADAEREAARLKAEHEAKEKADREEAERKAREKKERQAKAKLEREEAERKAAQEAQAKEDAEQATPKVPYTKRDGQFADPRKNYSRLLAPKASSEKDPLFNVDPAANRLSSSYPRRSSLLGTGTSSSSTNQTFSDALKRIQERRAAEPTSYLRNYNYPIYMPPTFFEVVVRWIGSFVLIFLFVAALVVIFGLIMESREPGWVNQSLSEIHRFVSQIGASAPPAN